MAFVRDVLACFSGLATIALLAQGCGSSTGDGSEFPNGTEGNGEFGPSDGPITGQNDPNAQTNGEDPLKGSCATASAETNRLPVYMQFIIDGSGSMDGYDGSQFIPGERETDPAEPTRQTGKKWIAVRDALGAFFDDLAAKPDPSIAVGMYLFSSNTTKPATGTDVPIDFVDAPHAATLKGRLAPPIFPTGGTPLEASINGQLGILRNYTPAAPVEPGGKYVLVAMTDGIPSDSKAGCISSVTAARTGNPNIQTFAVGVGNENANPGSVYDEHFMAQLAQAGGTAVPGCNTNWGDGDTSGVPCHFQVTPGAKSAAQIKADFLAAINAIRDAVTSCDFPLTRPAGSGDLDPSKVNVVFTPSTGPEATLPQDGANGWSYDDPKNPTTVRLHGKACADLKADPKAKIRIVIGCRTVSPK